MNYAGLFDNIEPIVICIRDPDADNQYLVFGPPVIIHDIDMGRANLSDPDEFAEWAESHRTEAASLRASGRAEAADCIEGLVNDMEADFA